MQEAVELDENPYLETVFSADVLGRLPSTGSDRVRVTALNLIGKNFQVLLLLAFCLTPPLGFLGSLDRVLCHMVYDPCRQQDAVERGRLRRESIGRAKPVPHCRDRVARSL